MASAFVGCANISVRTHAYLGSPKLPPTAPASVQILAAEPTTPKDRLGEILLGLEGNSSRDAIEQKLRSAAAQLGADAVFVTYDRMHVFPVAYGGGWGPIGMGERNAPRHRGRGDQIQMSWTRLESGPQPRRSTFPEWSRGPAAK